MSDFWDKNKGSITSGLKTAGKYSYQGTKYIAKTGYKAGKKNFNSRKKDSHGKKDGEEEEEEEDEGHAKHDNNRYRDPSAFPPPPVRGAEQQYQYQQPQLQQSQPQQPPYQQPAYQPAYQQPQPQGPPYQQPAYQPAYQQPAYQQPAYQQPPYQQPAYQQPPPQQQPPYQQPPPQQPAYQQPQYQQPYQQPQQVSSQSFEAPSPAWQQAPVSTEPPHPPPRSTSSQGPQGVAAYGAAPTYEITSTVPSGGSVVASSHSDPQASHIAVAASAHDMVHRPVHDPPAPADSMRPVYSRAGFPSPPLAGREAQADLVSATSTSGGSGSSVPGVKPYEYGSAEAKALASRLPINAVDLTALPPPPTHKDRSTPDLTSSAGNTSKQAENQDRESPSSRGIESAVKPGPPTRAGTAEAETRATKSPAGPPPPIRSRQAVQQSAVSSQANPPFMNEASAKNTDEEARGITGRFDYEVKVDYAPPPKPHRSVPDVSSKPSIARTSAPLTQNAKSNGSISTSSSPALPERQSTSTAVNSNRTAITTFEPPPKPFRRPQSSQHTSYSSTSSLPIANTNEDSNQRRDVSSFPPPPVRSRPSIQPTISTDDTGDGRVPPINPRGRLSSDYLPTERQHSIDEGSDSITGRKKAPPVVKPKPKGLLSRSSTAVSHPGSESREHPNASAVSAIADELAHIKLRKSGSTLLHSDAVRERQDHDQAAKPTARPAVPPKRSSLKHVPSPDKPTAGNSGRTDSSNPFELYLKDAVPSEEDRFHK
ncbi:hypothetical protein HG537_0B02170 [Torulaspora globosa]|uniref:Altered inheritance of mitochondria protein 3 n=1 Tax=Torulaspora globosa TaxID=48254 RepID=A0A7H9HNP5_9SACH|nr:hypothetical protein HG537_0B02170 [Torulaspora sp. CBS 2947]